MSPRHRLNLLSDVREGLGLSLLSTINHQLLAIRPSRLSSLLPLFVPVCAFLWLPPALATENVPHRPFALWADIPEPGHFTFGAVYEESEAYHILIGGKSYNVTSHADGERFGIDINQGYLSLQYGLTERWAADLSLGGTTVGWRYFDNGSVQSTTGLLDTSLGVRYQLFKEAPADQLSTLNSQLTWAPTLTLRVGAVFPGTYDQTFAFAPGVRSVAIEPEVLLRKHCRWPGLGVYGDGLFRWNRTTGNDQYIAAIGLFQQIKGWELDFGFRHLQTISGDDIVFDPNNPGGLLYPRAVRENNDSIEAGFSYTTKHHFRYGFQSRTVFDGNNTDRKFWVGGSIDFTWGTR